MQTNTLNEAHEGKLFERTDRTAILDLQSFRVQLQMSSDELRSKLEGLEDAKFVSQKTLRLEFSI